MTRLNTARPHVVIVGGGFAGLAAAKELGGAPVDVTLIDRHNHHLFQPLLYQVATAGLGAPDIASPLRKILRRHRNTTVLMAEVESVDPEQHRITTDRGVLDYDYLLLAAGATHSYFGREDWEPHAPGLKTLEDALEIRRRVLLAFEAAENEQDQERRRALLTFVVIGAGPTGVEMAGAIAEMARHTLVDEFRRFDPRDAEVILLDVAERVLPPYHERLSSAAQQHLEELGVEVRTGARVTHIDEGGVQIGDTTIAARTVIWAAGVQASPLGAMLGTTTDRSGRVEVRGDLTVPGLDGVFVVGDMAHLENEQGVVPGVAPAAVQQGRWAARNILRAIDGERPQPFRYRDKGSMATVGRAFAVAELGGLRLTGFIAWLAWLAVHLLYLVGFRNRASVLFDWMWAYMTYQRSARVVARGHLPSLQGQRRDARAKRGDKRPPKDLSCPPLRQRTAGSREIVHGPDVDHRGIRSGLGRQAGRATTHAGISGGRLRPPGL